MQMKAVRRMLNLDFVKQYKIVGNNMVDALLAHIGLAVQGNLPLAALCALAWGLVSVLFSPCHLAAIPVMAAHAAGYIKISAVKEAEDEAPSPAETLPGLETSLGFAAGYFLAIAGLGIVCALLGRVLDMDFEHFWMLPAGLVLLWFAWSLWREHDCSAAGRVLERLGRGLHWGPRMGSVVLGVGYGVLSGGCTLAFLAPVLLVSLPQGAATGVLLAVSFGLGHCLPMALVGFLGMARRAAPWGLWLLQVCRLRAAGAHSAANGHAELHARHAHSEHEHHALERVFRKVAAVGIGAGALVLLLHGFWE